MAAPAAAETDVPVLVDQHPIGIVIKSHDPPKDITFTIARGFVEYKRYDNVAGLPDRIGAYIARAINKAQGIYCVHWLSDDTESNELLGELLMPRFALMLDKYHNDQRKAAPKAKGVDARARYAQAIASGPYAQYFQDGGAQQRDGQAEVTITYEQHGSEKEQTWTRRVPQFVAEDWRPGDRQRMTIKGGPRGLSSGQYNTLEKVLFNVALPMPLIDFLVRP